MENGYVAERGGCKLLIKLSVFEMRLSGAK